MNPMLISLDPVTIVGKIYDFYNLYMITITILRHVHTYTLVKHVVVDGLDSGTQHCIF